MGAHPFTVQSIGNFNQHSEGGLLLIIGSVFCYQHVFIACKVPIYVVCGPLKVLRQLYQTLCADSFAMPVMHNCLKTLKEPMR